MQAMPEPRLDDRPDLNEAVQRARDFSGWTFDIDRRSLQGPPPWDYEERARELAAGARSIVDLGTGGGEVLSRIAPSAHGASVVASEEWHVNAPVADALLRPLGVATVRASSMVTPWRPAAFDLVLSRHEAIEPPEIDRILASGGTFFTQQVCPEQWIELRRYFPRATVFPDHWAEYKAWFGESGYKVSGRRFDYAGAFGSLADLVFMLTVASWTIPGFDLERDLDALLALERDLRTPEGIVLSEGLYILEARKLAVG